MIHMGVPSLMDLLFPGVDFYRDVRPEGGVVNLPENPERFRWSPSLVRSSVTNRPLSVISPTLDGGSTTRLGTLFLASD